MDLDNLQLTTGKEYIERQRELEQLLGISEISPFGTYDLDIFKQKLKQSSHADLQKLAHKVGLNPFLEKSRIKGALEREFLSYTKNMRKNLVPPKAEQFILDKDNPQHLETIRILGEIQ
jgi:hypothetical protein